MKRRKRKADDRPGCLVSPEKGRRRKRSLACNSSEKDRREGESYKDLRVSRRKKSKSIMLRLERKGRNEHSRSSLIPEMSRKEDGRLLPTARRERKKKKHMAGSVADRRRRRKKGKKGRQVQSPFLRRLTLRKKGDPKWGIVKRKREERITRGNSFAKEEGEKKKKKSDKFLRAALKRSGYRSCSGEGGEGRWLRTAEENPLGHSDQAGRKGKEKKSRIYSDLQYRGGERKGSILCPRWERLFTFARESFGTFVRRQRRGEAD